MQLTALRRSCSIASLRCYAKLTSKSSSAFRNSLLVPKPEFHSIYHPRSTLNGSKNTRNITLSPLFAQRTLIRKYVTKTVKVPTLAESITEGSMSKWNKKVGDFVQQDEEVATIETDKVDAPVNSPYSGTILELCVNEQDTVTVGQDLFKIELGDAATVGSDTTAPKEEVVKPGPEQAEIKEIKEEIKETVPPPSPAPSQSEVPKPDVTLPPSEPSFPPRKADVPYGEREERQVKMNRMRLRISERLKESQNTAASLTTFNEIDMSNIIELRNTYKDAIIKKHDIKLGFMSAFVKASVFALQEIPAVNASISESGDTILYRDYIDMSVAVATPKGLVTPVVRNAHLLSFVEIEKAIAELGQKAREGKMTIEDMAGGTFTISNGGVYGSLFGTPIINMPQSAILGMHATKERPIAVNGQIEIRPMMYVALTYDHRLIDGREAVTFLKIVKEQVEDPRRLLLSI